MYAKFPKINMLFDVYLTKAVSSSSAERAFSTLKRIKHRMRKTLSQGRLTNLARLNIEKDLISSIDIGTVQYLLALNYKEI